MKRGFRKWGIALGALAMSAVLVTAGCADGDVTADEVTAAPAATQTETPTPEPTAVEETQTLEPSAEPSYVTFGTETADGYSVIFTNGTGQEIRQIRVRNSDEIEYGDDLMPSDTFVLPDETFRLNVPHDPEADSPSASAASSAESVAMDGEEAGDTRAIAFNDTYDIQLQFADGREATLYDLGLADIDTAIIAYSAEADVAYISYVSTVTKETVSTLDAQIARSRDEAAAALEEELEAAEHTATPAGGGSSSGSSSSSSNESSGSSSSSEGSSSGGSTGADESSSSSSEDESSSGGSDSGSSESSGGDEPEQDLGECIEDNVIWND